MIKSFRHKSLTLFYRTGKTSGIQSNHASRLRMQLAVLDTAVSLNDINRPGYKLHQLKGDLQKIWSIRVSANWRITFEFSDGVVHLVNYEDYHS